MPSIFGPKHLLKVARYSKMMHEQDEDEKARTGGHSPLQSKTKKSPTTEAKEKKEEKQVSAEAQHDKVHKRAVRSHVPKDKPKAPPKPPPLKK